MQLREIEIQNYRAIRHRVLSLADAMGRVRPVTVLAGPNGCGKTSVLYAIYRALSGAMGYYSDDVPGVTDDEIFREGGAGSWSFQPNRIIVQLQLVYSGEEQQAAPQLLEATRILQRPRTDGSLVSVPSLTQGQLGVTWEYPPAQYADGTYKQLGFVRTTTTGGATWLALPRWAIRGWTHRPRRLVELDLLDKIGILRMFAQNRGKRWVAAEEREAFPIDGDEGFNADEQVTHKRRPNATVSGILKVLADAAHGRRPNGAPAEDHMGVTRIPLCRRAPV